MKLVLNKCYGGFGLSHEAVLRYHEIKGNEIWFHTDNWGCTTYTTKEVDSSDQKSVDENYWYYYDIERSDPVLVQVVEELREKANGECAQLEIIDIPDDVQWELDEYDGIESVHECHRSW